MSPTVQDQLPPPAPEYRATMYPVEGLVSAAYQSPATPVQDDGATGTAVIGVQPAAPTVG